MRISVDHTSNRPLIVILSAAKNLKFICFKMLHFVQHDKTISCSFDIAYANLLLNNSPIAQLVIYYIS